MFDEYSHVTDGLVYSPDNVSGPGCDQGLFTSDLAGCECTTDCANSCSHLVKYGRNYELGLLIKSSENQPIFECNERCSCEPTRCANRVVQFGPSPHLEVVTVSQEKGLGVVSKMGLRPGQFVTCYAGEVLGMAVAKSRASRQTRQGGTNYIIVVREHAGGSRQVETVVDPTVVGNIGRYLNHSCDPNLTMVPVRVDCMVPHLALFTSREVMQGEELTFNYGDPETGVKKCIDVEFVDVANVKDEGDTQTVVDDDVEDVENLNVRIKCLCKSKHCKGVLPFDPALL